uniref:uncharacterized protein LOC120339589 n=1 Tax=Styela clava TaxID=7725 RepID=UPI00193A188E|nr:uncharacterized protein LOC120339589 [Styela clava]
MTVPTHAFLSKWQEVCLNETPESVSSISTERYVPQPLDNRSHIVCNRLFVGGFPPGTSSKELINVFSHYGKVISCNVMSEDENKNYGFVTFQDVGAAQAVLDISSKKRAFFLRGHALKIKRAVFKPRKSGHVTEETASYRGKHDIVRYYGRSTQFEFFGEKIGGYPIPSDIPAAPSFPVWHPDTAFASQQAGISPMASVVNFVPVTHVYLPVSYIQSCSIPTQAKAPSCAAIQNYLNPM